MTTGTVPTARERYGPAAKAGAKREEALMEAMAYQRRSRELTVALIAALKVVVQKAQLVAPHADSVEALLAQADALLTDKQNA